MTSSTLSTFERELARLSDQALERTLRDFDVQSRQLMETVLKETTDLLMQSLSGGSPSTSGTSSVNAASGFAQSINAIVQSALAVTVNNTTTTTSVSSSETNRSQLRENAYKASRAQQQSEASAELNRGNRNT